MCCIFLHGRKRGSKGLKGKQASKHPKLSLEHCGGLWSPALLQRRDGAVGSGDVGGAREASREGATNYLTANDFAVAELM